jgi:hypothetical protein
MPATTVNRRETLASPDGRADPGETSAVGRATRLV